MVNITLSPASAKALGIHSVSHAKLAEMSRGLEPQTSNLSIRRLDVLLQGAELHIPQRPPKPEPSLEYQALMERLRQEQDAKAYAAMVGAREANDESVESITREVSDQISVMLNILFSSIFTGLAVWYATSNLTTWKRHEPLRVGLSLLVAFTVAIAEIVLYDSYKRKMADAGRRERATAEVKALIQTLD